MAQHTLSRHSCAPSTAHELFPTNTNGNRDRAGNCHHYGYLSNRVKLPRDRPPIPCGSSLTAAASSSLLFLLGGCFRCRLRCRFTRLGFRAAAPTIITHVRHLLACIMTTSYHQFVILPILVTREMHNSPSRPPPYAPTGTDWIPSMLTVPQSIWLALLQSSPELRYAILSGLPLACPRERHSPRRNRLSCHQ